MLCNHDKAKYFASTPVNNPCELYRTNFYSCIVHIFPVKFINDLILILKFTVNIICFNYIQYIYHSTVVKLSFMHKWWREYPLKKYVFSSFKFALLLNHGKVIYFA